MNCSLHENPWLSIWVHPRKTIKGIVESNPNYCLWVLSAIFGFSSLIGIAQTISLGNHLSLLAIVVLSAILSPIWGFLIFSLSAWLLFQTGKWIGGSGDVPSIRTVVAWSHVPASLTVVVWTLLLFLFGQQLLQNVSLPADLTIGKTFLVFVGALIQMTASVWGVVIFINGLMVVQLFSIGKALLNVLLMVLLLGLILFVFLTAIQWSCSSFFDVPLITSQ